MSTEISSSRVLRFGSFDLALPFGELRKQGLRVKLQDQPLAVLSLLLEHPGEVVLREEIRQRIWPADTFVDFDVGVNNAVKKIRQALGDSAETPLFVETIPRHGYRFIAPVESVSPAAAVGVSHERHGIPNVSLPEPPAAPSEIPRARRRGINLIWLGIAAAAALAAGGAAFRLVGTPPRPGAAVPAALASVAVLPFENLSAPETGDYFAEGMTDALITDLAQFSGLRVISRTSSLQYRRTTKTAREIGRELHVGAILEGSVVRTGSRVRINVQLIDATDDRVSWARFYERELRDILEVQQEVATAVVAKTAAQLGSSPGQPRRAAREVNPDAYEAYLKGRYYLSGGPGVRMTVDAAQAAVNLFQQASRIDPAYAPAYAGLAEAYYQFGFAYFLHTMSPAESARLSEAAALKAVQIDDSLSAAHLSLARVRLAQWRWLEAKEEARRAMELDPADTAADAVYSDYLVSAGRAGEAVSLLKRAVDRDPLSRDLNGRLSWWLYQARDYEGSLRQCRVEVDLNPANPHYRCFALAYEQQGRYAEAIDGYRRFAGLFADPNASANARAELARALARSGQPAEARRLLNDVRSLDRPDIAYPLALAYAALGDRDTAFRFLEEALEERSGWLPLVKVEPALDPLRGDPRFDAIVHRMGLDAVP